MEHTVLLQLATKITDFKWFIFLWKEQSTWSCRRWAHGSAKIPHEGISSSYWVWGRWGAVRCLGTSHWPISLYSLSYREGLRGGCTSHPCPHQLYGVWEVKTRQGEQLLGGGMARVDQRGRRARGVEQDQKDMKGSSCWMGKAGWEDGVGLAVSSRLGRGEGYRGTEREREDVWPGSFFLKCFFIIAVLQYSLNLPSGNFFFWQKYAQFIKK